MRDRPYSCERRTAWHRLSVAVSLVWSRVDTAITSQYYPVTSGPQATVRVYIYVVYIRPLGRI